MVLNLDYNFFDDTPGVGSYSVVNLMVFVGGYRFEGWKASDGRMGGMSLDNPVRTPPVLVAANSPFRVFITLQGSASGTYPAETVAVDASRSLTFNQDGPAILVQPGYTVNIPELYIADNYFVPQDTEVPEPATLPVVCISLTLLAFYLRRK